MQTALEIMMNTTKANSKENLKKILFNPNDQRHQRSVFGSWIIASNQHDNSNCKNEL